MKNIKRKLAKFMVFTLFANSTLSGVYTEIFANNKTATNTTIAKSSDISFLWEKSLSLTDSLVTTSTTNSDEVFLSWKFGTDPYGSEVSTGEYELTYNIDNNKQVKFLIKKLNNVAEITYSIYDETQGDYTNQVKDEYGYQVYKQDIGTYITPSKNTYPEISTNYKVHYDDVTGEATEVKFSITKGNGFSFKYRNNTIKFKWDTSGNFYFSTNGVKQGNIYDFNLNLSGATNTDIQNSLQIFTGINTTTLNVNVMANGGKTTIDQTTRPIIEYPGDDAKIEVEFDMPKVWDDTSKSYVFESVVNNPTPMEVVLDLGYLDISKKDTITINNIYENFSDTGNTSLTATNSSNTYTVTATREKNEKVKLVIENLEDGMIFNPVQLDVSRQEDKFLTKSLNIEIGKFYTYPKFSIVSLSESEFYIKVEPFKGYNGHYTIYAGNTSSTLSKWSTYEEKNLGAESILIPINLSALNPQTKYFKVEFSLDPTDDLAVGTSQVFSSQILKYTPYKSDVILGTPTDFEVLESAVIYNPISEKKELIVDLRWNIGNTDILGYLIENNNGAPVDITYTLYKGSTPTDTEKQEFAKIKVTIANNNGNIEITNISEIGNGNNLTNWSYSYSSQVASGERVTSILPTVTFSLPISSAESNEIFSSPSINFISIRGEYTIGSETTITSESSSVNITINDALVVKVPQPQNIQTTNIDRESFDVTFSTMNWENTNSILYSYKNKVLEKIGLTLKEDSVKYSFYITQDKNLLDKLIKGEDIGSNIKTFDYNNNTISEFDFSENSVDNTKTIDLLRKNYIIEIKNVLQVDFQSELQKLTLKGLDKNQVYYVVAKIFVTPYEKETDIKKENYTEESQLSTIVTATTLSIEDTPSENEKKPATPTNFTKENVKVNSSNLIWDRVQETNSSSTLEYQFIRVQGTQLDNNFLNSTDSFAESFNNVPTSAKFGFRTSGTVLQTYSETQNSFTTASTSDLEYINIFGSKGNILDKTLTPNTIYFYYIRTVRVVDGKDVAYSSWTPLSVTTSNITAPKNLTIETSYKNMINTTKETVISFVVDGITKEEFIQNYTVQYSTKRDTDNWSADYSVNTSDLFVVENTDGTLKVYYLVKNLEHSSYYSIRVRLHNVILNISSDYSNEATHRTDTDSEKNEYDAIVNEWTENYITLLEQILNRDFWYVTNNLSTTSVLYRPGHIENLINSSNSSIIELEKGLDGSKKEYYIPASELQKIIDSNKGLKISFKDTEVILSNTSLNLNGNIALTSILENIKEGQSQDYFVKISANFNEGSYVVDGSNNVSPVVGISLELIGVNKIISDWDNYMFSILIGLIEDDFLYDIEAYLENAIKNNHQNSEIVLNINKKLENLQTTFGSRLSTQIKGITKRSYIVESVTGNIIIAHSIDSSISVSGYTLENYVWKGVTISTYGDKKAIYTTKLGSYVFTGSKVIISGIGNIENGTLITQIITKYSLEDYLGKGTVINLSTNLTRNEVIGIAARISGATRSQDPISFFATKGVTLSNRNLDTNITTQEAIFLIMKAYELRTNTSIDTIKITNYGLTAGITGLNTTYKKAVQVAFQLGIYTNQNISANGSITAQEFLQCLARLINKVGL